MSAVTQSLEGRERELAVDALAPADGRLPVRTSCEPIKSGTIPGKRKTAGARR